MKSSLLSRTSNTRATRVSITTPTTITEGVAIGAWTWKILRKRSTILRRRTRSSSSRRTKRVSTSNPKNWPIFRRSNLPSAKRSTVSCSSRSAQPLKRSEMIRALATTSYFPRLPSFSSLRISNSQDCLVWQRVPMSVEMGPLECSLEASRKGWRKSCPSWLSDSFWRRTAIRNRKKT